MATFPSHDNQPGVQFVNCALQKSRVEVDGLGKVAPINAPSRWICFIKGLLPLRLMLALPEE